MKPFSSCKVLDIAHVAAFLFLLVLQVPPAGAQLSNVPLEEFPVTDSSVYAIAAAGDSVYIGGNFAHVGPRTGPGAPIEVGSGQVLAGHAKVNGLILAAVADGAGGWYVGGDFTEAGGRPRNRIARIRADGSVDPAFNPNADGLVRILAVSGDTVYVGGNFTSIGGQTRNGIAALSAATGTVTAWNPNASPSEVHALAVSGDTVYAGGGFTSIGGQSRNYIAALSAATGTAAAWNPNANGTIYALAVSGDTIYAGGAFSSIGGQIRRGIAALSAATGNATGWNPNASSNVRALAVSGDTVYVGGDFSSIGGQNRNGIAALSAATGNATAWNPNASPRNVHALAVSGDTVYAGGAFSSIGGQSRNNIAALSAATGTVTAWNPNSTGVVYALAVSGDAVYAGGAFSNIGLRSRNRIARIRADGSVDPAFNPNADGLVWTLAVSGDTVYAGGEFTSIGGQPRNRIAALEAATGAVTAWNPNASSNVRALAVSGDTVYAGGAFTSIGGQPRNGIAALDAATGTVTAWNPNANGPWVEALAVSGDTIYVGGDFRSIGGQPRNRIAALDAATGNATAWNPNLSNGTVGALAVSGNTVYAGGSFGSDLFPASIGGQTRNRIAALSAASGNATGWNPNPSNTVNALAVSGDTVYAGGEFTSIGGQPRNRIAALEAATGAVTAWNPNASSNVRALAVSGDTVYVGGDFTSIGGSSLYHQYFAAFGPPRPAVPSDPHAAADSAGSIEFSWTDNAADETGYRVYADPGAGSPVTVRALLPPDSASWTWTGLTPNTAYSFQVAAIGELANSARTPLVTVHTLAGPPVVGGNVAPSLPPSGVYSRNSVFRFLNPAGFGPGTDGGGAYRVRDFSHAWTTEAGYVFNGSEPAWSAGALELSGSHEGGVYYLHLRSFNEEGLRGGEHTLGPYTILPVTLDFSADVTAGLPPLAVRFTNLSGGSFETLSWNFGDGAMSAEEDPLHTFSAPGVYDITLAVTVDGNEVSLVQPRLITVYGAVTANFTGSPAVGIGPLQAAFTNTSSGSFTTLQWDFGDGGTSAAENPVHTYAQPGTYTVSLTASGPGGEDTRTRTGYIRVYAPVTAAFTATPAGAATSRTLDFTSQSAGDFTALLWDFGDGGVSGAANPRHTYAAAGDYTIRLTASGPGGTHSVQQTRFVGNRPPVAGVAQAQITLNKLGDTATLDASPSSDADGDRLRYSWREDPLNPALGVLPLDSEWNRTLRVYFPEPGVYIFDLVVGDGEDLSTNETFVSVTVAGLTGGLFAIPSQFTTRLPNVTIGAFSSLSNAENFTNPLDVWVSDSQGRYRFENLAPGSHTLAWKSPGFTSNLQSLLLNSAVTRRNWEIGRPAQIPVSGRVTNASGVPQADVTVSIVSGSNVHKATTTGLDGAFEFFNVREGSWLVQLWKPGAAAEVRDINIGPDTPEQNYTLRGSGVTGTLTGRVTLAGTDAPVPGAQVQFVTGAGATTNAGGAYTIAGLPEGAYVATVSKAGLAPYRDPNVRIYAGQNERDFVLNYDGAGPAIIGEVRDAVDGRPVRNAVIGIENAEGFLLRSAVSDFSGYYVLRDVPPGGITLVARAEGYQEKRAQLTAAAAIAVDIALERGPGHAPVPQPDASAPFATLTANKTLLTNLSEQVQLTAGPAGPGTVRYFWRQHPQNPARIEIPAGAVNLAALSFALPVPGRYLFEAAVTVDGVPSVNTAQVEVRVAGLKGKVSLSPSDGVFPIPNIAVRAYTSYASAAAWSSSNIAELTNSGSTGAFTFETLAPGSYWIAARDNDNPPVYEPWGPVQRAVNAASGRAGMEINLVKAAYRVGGVIKREGTLAPVENARVVVAPGLVAESFQTSTAVDGTYVINGVPSGDQVFLVFREGYETIARIFSVGANISNRDFFLKPATGLPAQLGGTVTSAFGGIELPIANAEVVLGGVTRTFTDSLGRFTIPDLSPGLYAGIVRRAGYIAAPLAPFGFLELRSGPNETAYSLDFDGPGPTLTARFETAAGAPVPGVTVRVIERRSLKAGEKIRKGAGFTADATGYLELRDVPAGFREFEITLPGGAPYIVSANVEGDMRLPVTAAPGGGAPAEGEGEGENPAAGAAAILLAAFRTADADHSGALSLAEMTGAGIGQPFFSLLNANGDDFLQVSELLDAAAGGPIHRADRNGDGAVQLAELLRVIQLFNALGYHCADNAGATEDGFVPGTNPAKRGCTPHAADYAPRDWRIALSELLRLIQFYNSRGYRPCQTSEDDFCPGQMG